MDTGIDGNILPEKNATVCRFNCRLACEKGSKFWGGWGGVKLGLAWMVGTELFETLKICRLN